jgi:hypothetical protein
MDNAQKDAKIDYNAPLSEPFRLHLRDITVEQLTSWSYVKY